MRRLVVSFWIIAFSLCGCDQALRNVLSLASHGDPSGTTSTIQTFSWIGGTFTSNWRWLTGQTFSFHGTTPGSLGSNTVTVADSINGYLYASDGYVTIYKFNLSTGALLGMIGAFQGSFGTCPTIGVASGWCTGGVPTTGLGDGAFGSIKSIAIDTTNGFLYAIDGYTDRIEKFNLTTGAFVGAIGYTSASTGTCPASGVTTGWCTGGSFTAGSGDGSLASASSLAVDAAHDALYVAQNKHLDKFTLSTGIFVGSVGKTTASSGTCPASGIASSWCTGGTFTNANADGAYSFSGQIAVDATNGFLFVTQTDSRKVSKLTIATGAFVGAIGATSASSGTCPASGVATGWCTGGTFATSSVDGGFSGGTGLAIDLSNDLMYVSDVNSGRISKFTLSTGAFVGSVGELTASSGTCPSSGVATSWCTGGAFGQSLIDGAYYNPFTLSIDPANSRVLVGDSFRIASFNSSTGAFLAAMGEPASGVGVASTWTTASMTLGPDTSTSDGGFDYASDVAVDSVNGFFYVLDTNNARIQKFNLSTGAFVGAIGWLTSSTGTCPNSGAANSWCTGGTFTSNSADGALWYPSQIALDVTHDALYVADNVNNRVQKFVASTGATVGSIGRTTASIGTCPASGAATGWCTGGTFASGSSDGEYNSPVAVVVDPINNFIYVFDNNERVAKINASTGSFVGAIGETSATSGTCPASGVATSWCTGGSFVSDQADGAFESPAGMGIDPINGFLYVSDSWNANIQKFNLSTGAFVGAIGSLGGSTGTCASSGPAAGWCTGGIFSSGNGDGEFNLFAGTIAVDPINNAMYVSDPHNLRVQKFNLATGAVIGSIGFAKATTGTCALGPNISWCTGGTFDYGGYKNGSFDAPMGLGIDTSGNLYLADDIRVVRIVP